MGQTQLIETDAKSYIDSHNLLDDTIKLIEIAESLPLQPDVAVELSEYPEEDFECLEIQLHLPKISFEEWERTKRQLYSLLKERMSGSPLLGMIAITYHKRK